MAQNGYIVFTMDGRGSSNRGMKFEQAVFRNLGETEMTDQLKGVDYLKSLPYVDGEKLGIHGWRFLIGRKIFINLVQRNQSIRFHALHFRNQMCFSAQDWEFCR